MGDEDDMPSKGEQVYVRTLQRSGVATVERVRRDGRLAVVFADGTRSRVRAGQAKSLSPAPMKAPPPIVVVDLPPLPQTFVQLPRSFVVSPKVKTMRDRKYLDWLRDQPCVACGFPHGCDPSHHGRHGLGIKAPDDRAVSMCRRCHDHWELGAPRRVFARGHLDDDATDKWLREAARTQRAAYVKERGDA